MTRQIIGSKGGGGSSFVTKPDTLRSDDSFEILLGLGSGRWKGLTEGLGSLKINGVPMENADGSSNFEDIVAIFADGNPLEDQLVSFRLGGGGNTVSVNTQLANPNTGVPGPWVSGAVSTPGANYIDLRFVVSQLFYQDDNGIRENTANVEIEMRPSGSPTWVNPFIAATSNTTVYDQAGYDYVEPDSTALYRLYLSREMFNVSGTGFVASNNTNLQIRGKTNSAYVKELRIDVPNSGTYANVNWEVRARLVEKDTVDNDPIQERRNIVFESISAVSKETLGDHPDWDGLVWLQLIGKASDQFNGFPEIEGVYDTKICKTPPVPSIWDPDTRQYTGTTWAGDYEEHFTTDPAWQLKEFIEDPVQGVAGLYPGSTLDKWDALEASKYYSELVDDGQGGTHPRFNMNLVINEAREVEEMIAYLAGSVNSYAEDVGGGVWRLFVDKPETPVMLFSQANVFGEFNYSHTDVDGRFNDWRGTFLNEDLDYETDTVRVYDQTDIDANGTRFTEIALIGCTNRQEALRRLMFRMRVSLNEYKIVNFVTNRVGRYITPLSTILVADESLNADHLVKSASRVESYAASSVTLMRPVRLEVGVSYVMHFTTEDQETITRNVTNPDGSRGDVTAITLDADLPANVMAESVVALEAVGLPANPVSYRVISVDRDEESEDQYIISASIIDSGKWNAMDNVSEAAITSQAAAVEIDSPTAPAGGMFDVLYYNTAVDTKRMLQVNWDRPASLFLDSFKVEYRLNDSPWKLLAENHKDSYIELEAPEAGTYDFKITAMDRRGVQSNPLVGQYVLTNDREVTPPTHLRGDLASRPATGSYDGYRYTVTDQGKPYTTVWNGTAAQWEDEANLVTEGTDIGVENGATVGMTVAEAADFAQAQADISTIDGEVTTLQGQVTTLITDVDAVELDVADLYTTYGSTASAAASAAYAEALAEAIAGRQELVLNGDFRSSNTGWLDGYSNPNTTTPLDAAKIVTFQGSTAVTAPVGESVSFRSDEPIRVTNGTKLKFVYDYWYTDGSIRVTYLHTDLDGTNDVTTILEVLTGGGAASWQTHEEVVTFTADKLVYPGSLMNVGTNATATQGIRRISVADVTSAEAAETSRLAAETAQAGAETAETNAVTAQTGAEAAEALAVTSATNAATSETNAGNSATAAATSASAAATSASDASTSASAADTSATNAATSAANASTSESNASASETNAASSAAAASSSATLAASSSDEAFASAKLTKTVINEPDDYRVDVDSVDLTLGDTPASATKVSDADLGPSVEIDPNSDGQVRIRVPLAIAAGRKYRLTIPVKYVDAGATGSNTRLRIRPRDYDIVTGVSLGDASTGWLVYSDYMTPGGTTTMVRELDADTYLADPTNGQLMFLWLFDDPNIAGCKFRFGGITWDDVTSEEAAATSASSASVSETAAAASATSAAGSAAAASTSETLTAQYAGVVRDTSAQLFGSSLENLDLFTDSWSAYDSASREPDWDAVIASGEWTQNTDNSWDVVGGSNYLSHLKLIRVTPGRTFRIWMDLEKTVEDATDRRNYLGFRFWNGAGGYTGNTYLRTDIVKVADGRIIQEGFITSEEIEAVGAGTEWAGTVAIINLGDTADGHTTRIYAFGMDDVSESQAAQQSLTETYPTAFSSASAFVAGFNDTESDAAPDYVTVSPATDGNLLVVPVDNASVRTNMRWLYDLVPGRTLEVSVEAKVDAGYTGAPQVTCRAYALTNAYGNANQTESDSHTFTAGDTWETLTFTIDTDTSIAAGAIWKRIEFDSRNLSGVSTISWRNLKFDDVTLVNQAEAQATIATTQATNASASAAAASTSETLAASYETGALAAQTAAETAETNATAQATIATTQAGVATSEAAAAATSATLAVRYQQASALGNLVLQPTGDNGVDEWNGTVTASTDVPTGAPAGADSLRIQGDGVYQTKSYLQDPNNRTYRVTGWIKVVDQGTGSGFFMALRDSTGALVEQLGAAFTTNATWVQFTREHTVTTSSTTISPAFDFSATAGDVYLYDIRFEDITDLKTLDASVTTNAGAIATIEGAAAYYETIVAAGGGNPAMVQLLAGEGGSKVGLVGDVIALGNDVDGIIDYVLTIEGGKAKLNNALIRDLAVAPRTDSEIFLPVVLKPLELLAADGDAVQYQNGDTFGAVPSRIVGDISGLPALAAGDRYEAKGTSITATGFTASVKKITAPTQTNRDSGAGTNVGGTPQWQVDKPSSDDAYDDKYQYQWDGTLPRISLVAEDFDPILGTYYVATYQETFYMYYNDGTNGWQIGGSKTVTRTIQGWYTTAPSEPPTSTSFTNETYVTTITDAIGQHAGKEFGIHETGSGTITSFDKVTYVSETSSGSTSVTTAIPWMIYPPEPN